MEGVTDLAFRQVIAAAGRPDLFFTEFTNVSSYASAKGRANALERLQIAPTDAPIIAQIWGKNPAHFAETCAALKDLGFAGIDLNFGCPDRHVNKAGGGAAMIRTPDLAVACFRNAVENSGGLPVSIKTRLGFSFVDEYQTWLPTLLRERPAALTVHLRTRKEMSKVPAHYDLIPEIIKLRDELSPETKLLINGDIKDKAQGLALCQAHPGLDGFMIGRGVFENPYCFTEYKPSKEDLLGLLKLHLDLWDNIYGFSDCGENLASRARSGGNGRGLAREPRNDGSERRARTKASSTASNGKTRSFEPLKHYFKIYIRDFPGASDLRTELMACHSVADAQSILQRFDQHPENFGGKLPA